MSPRRRRTETVVSLVARCSTHPFSSKRPFASPCCLTSSLTAVFRIFVCSLRVHTNVQQQDAPSVGDTVRKSTEEWWSSRVDFLGATQQRKYRSRNLRRAGRDRILDEDARGRFWHRVVKRWTPSCKGDGVRGGCLETGQCHGGNRTPEPTHWPRYTTIR